jgi:5-deoxy-glucuronate isomerase
VSLLVKAGDFWPEGVLEYVEFAVRDAPFSGETSERELCMVMLGGTCDVRSDKGEWTGVGERKSPFDGLPHAVYLPPGTAFEVSGSAEVALCSAPASKGAEARLIEPGDVGVSTRGSGAMERTIHDILMEDAPAESLLITEVLTPDGHWSSYPPHKHDTPDPPRETYLEELYYHRLRRPEGWAIQRVYTRDASLDESIAVGDGDCVLVPRGYHPVSAAPGFDLYYLNIMAGPIRQWRVTLDPDVERAVQ